VSATHSRASKLLIHAQTVHMGTGTDFSDKLTYQASRHHACWPGWSYTFGVRYFFTAVVIMTLTGYFLRFPASASAQNRCEGMEEQWRLQPQPENWSSLHRLFKRFGQCNDQEIADGISYYVGQLFLKQWAHLDALNRLSGADKPFGEFVLRHIDATLSGGELRAILDLSKSHCPTGESGG